MLNKKVCRVCVKKRRKQANIMTTRILAYPWDERDDVNWACGRVLCDYWPEPRVWRIRDDCVPEWCLYAVEHVVS